MDIIDPIQQSELDRLNKALAEQSIQPDDVKKLKQDESLGKFF